MTNLETFCITTINQGTIALSTITNLGVTLNSVAMKLEKPVAVMLTTIQANCGDSGSPQFKPIYFTSQVNAENWVANPDNAHRLPKAPDYDKSKAPAVVYRQTEARMDINKKYYLYRGEARGNEEVFVVK